MQKCLKWTQRAQQFKLNSQKLTQNAPTIKTKCTQLKHKINTKFSQNPHELHTKCTKALQKGVTHRW